MSGGVDSSAALLLAEGFSEKVTGVTLALASPDSPEIEADRQNTRDAKAICDRLGAEHISLDAHEEFSRAVIEYFIRAYMNGLTPNPCVICNRDIKFGFLWDFAKKNGFDTLVTGHYADKIKLGSYEYIKMAADAKKDQSYMLAYLSQEQITSSRFPLGKFTKDEVRSIAAKNGFESASRRDSQDICFVPDGNYVGFMRKNGVPLPECGNYIDVCGNILGRHKGHVSYTIGQRKGLGIAVGKHIFVLSKDAERNEVTLGDEDKLFKSEIRLKNLNFPSDSAILDKSGTRISAKLRYAHKPSVGEFTRISEDEGIIKFDEPQRAPSPGQFAVIYTEESAHDSASDDFGILLCGGEIV